MVSRVLMALVRLYQLTLSPWVGRECRFIPSCSNYALEALEKHGALRGTYMTVCRLLRCHPFGGRGYDPVPEEFHWCCWRSGDQVDKADFEERSADLFNNQKK